MGKGLFHRCQAWPCDFLWPMRCEQWGHGALLRPSRASHGGHWPALASLLCHENRASALHRRPGKDGQMEQSCPQRTATCVSGDSPSLSDAEMVCDCMRPSSWLGLACGWHCREVAAARDPLFCFSAPGGVSGSRWCWRWFHLLPGSPS